RLGRAERHKCRAPALSRGDLLVGVRKLRCVLLECWPVIPLVAWAASFKIALMELVITLFVVGAILLLLETVLPGMIAGAIGLICVIAAVIQSYVAFGPQTGTGVLMG